MRMKMIAVCAAIGAALWWDVTRGINFNRKPAAKVNDPLGEPSPAVADDGLGGGITIVEVTDTETGASANGSDQPWFWHEDSGGNWGPP